MASQYDARRTRGDGKRWIIGGILALALVVVVSSVLFARQRFLDDALYREMTAMNTEYREPNRDRIRELVRNGASANLDMGQEATPLDYATRTDDLPLILELLDRGANPNQNTARNQIALMHVKSKAAAELLLSRGADLHFRYGELRQPVSSAIEAGPGSLEALYPLLARGCGVDETNSRGETGLMWVARSGRPKRVLMLLDMGANPTLTDKNGRTAADHVRRQLQRETSQPARERLVRALHVLQGVKAR